MAGSESAFIQGKARKNIPLLCTLKSYADKTVILENINFFKKKKKI